MSEIGVPEPDLRKNRVAPAGAAAHLVAMSPAFPMSTPAWVDGHRRAWKTDSLAFLSEEYERHGSAFRFRLGPQEIVVVADAPSVDMILRSKAAAFVKPPLLARFGKTFFGQALTRLDGSEWLDRRGALQKSVGARGNPGPRLEGMHATFRANGAEDVVAKFAACFTRVLARWLLAVEPVSVDEHCSSIERSLDALDRHFTAGVPWPSWCPLPRLSELRRERRRQREIVGRWLAAAPVDAPLVSGLGNFDAGARLDEANIAIGLGAHQMALAAAWTLLELASHPGEQARAAVERGAVNRALLEALRLHPPFYALVRRASLDILLPCGPIRRGTTVLVSPYLMHRNRRVFEHPDKFRPSRWAAQPAEELAPGTFFPFGAGPRACIARHVLVPTVSDAVARVVERYELECTTRPLARAGVVLGFGARPSLRFTPRGSHHVLQPSAHPN